MKKQNIIFFIILVSLAFGASKYDKEIKNNSNKLESAKTAVIQTDQQIKKLAFEINQQQSILDNIQSNIVTLNNLIAGNKNTIDEATTEMQTLEQTAEQITKQKTEQEARFAEIIVENFASSKAKDLANKRTKEDVVSGEIYSILGDVVKSEIAELDTQYDILNQNKFQKEVRIKEVKITLNENNSKKNNLAKLEKAQLDSIKKLEKKHIEYQNQLAKNQQTQQKLTSILKQLNILKAQEVVVKKEMPKSKKKSIFEDMNASTKQQYKIVSPNIIVDVKKIGSSTGELKIARYLGAKTISPLKNFTIVKRFGKYYDDVYNMEFFNESVTLAAKEQDSKVVSVLPGKVIYEKKNQSILDNVVIIQHPNGLHTVYSHLDKISPTISTGKYLESGYTIGRVSGNLVFQVTQNNAFIDPLDLIN